MRLWFTVIGSAVVLCAAAPAAHTNNILITGYWPPTNEMIRPFSPNPDQNPGGWVGGNWESRGYDIFGYFPEFPGGLDANPKGDGDFEVDYQDTSADWFRITAEIQPVAIITFGRADEDRDWELEGGHTRLRGQDWAPDYQEPTGITFDLPIAREPMNNTRYSSLPMDEIIAAVESDVPTLDVYSTDVDTSNFLCNFIGYHACWYHDTHSDPLDEAWNVAAGHIHVGSAMTDAEAGAATEATLRALTTYLDTVIPEPSSLLLVVALTAIPRRRG